MNADERERAESQLRIYDLLLGAMERRQEVFDLVCSSDTPAQAKERVRNLFGVSEPDISQAVLDMQIRRWTCSERKRILDSATELRRELGASD